MILASGDDDDDGGDGGGEVYNGDADDDDHDDDPTTPTECHKFTSSGGKSSEIQRQMFQPHPMLRK